MISDDIRKVFFILIFSGLSVFNVWSESVQGFVYDALTKDPLIGVLVKVDGVEGGKVTDIDGFFELDLKAGVYTLRFSYTGYSDYVYENLKVDDGVNAKLNIVMESAVKALNEVSVAARKHLEGEYALLAERKNSSVGIENIGAKELAVKGIGNAEEGVKKISGVSVADAGQIIVRGLGDRYSTTTLNGLAIASPNPDNKLIPLDLFPSNTVQYISVSKVFEVESFADYSGAHIDINTKEQISDNFFEIGFDVGGKVNTLGKDFYQMDRAKSLFRNPGMDEAALDMSLKEFDNYVLTKDIFNTSFDVSKKASMPDLGGSLGFGHSYNICGQTLSIVAAGKVSNDWQILDNAFYQTLEATGNVQDHFSYDGYTQSLSLAALCCVGYTLRKSDRIGYTFFYSRNATDTYQRREGTDAEGHELIGSNDITHIYTLNNHQVHGVHRFGETEKWQVDWDASYTNTGSDEPDRRQVMFVKDDEERLSFFKLNRQETMRYYGELDEKEWNAKLQASWKWREGDNVRLGFNFKDKDRDYMGTRFYYNINKLNSYVDDIYSVSDYIYQEAISDGTVVIERKMQPKDSYKAGNDIFAGFVATDYHINRKVLLNIGLRYEYSRQWVNYATDGGEKYAERRELNKDDVFPSFNIKYNLNEWDIFRLSASRTVTRPSFIEMAPFLYQESYGSAQLRGNAELVNGYNYNFDLRYERFANRGDMISITAYFKYLDSPIERVQGLNGGATEHTFKNADNGIAAGAEVEVKANIIECLRFAANLSYMYTNVKLPESGAYTNKERSLQGASPILANADLTYSTKIKEKMGLSVALMYNLQGKRIHAVGVSGLGDVEQQSVHTLNLNACFDVNKHFSFKLLFKDLLNRDDIFKQDVPNTGEKIVVERYKKGSSFEVAFGYKI